MPLLEDTDLRVTLNTSARPRRRAEGHLFYAQAWPDAEPSLIGESGCGKTITALALMGLLPMVLGGE